MRYLIITDIYANLEAFEAVLNDAIGLYDKVWCLGDLVAFGPNPNECVDLLLTLDHKCVAGDGDWIALDKSDPNLLTSNLDDLNERRKYAQLLTREKLSKQTRNYLDGLPTFLVENDSTLVHASPRHPLIEDVHFPVVAKPNFKHFQTKYCFNGHTNVPAIYQEPTTPDGECEILVPYSETSPVKYGKSLHLGQQRFMINPGGVGGSDCRYLAFHTSFYGIFDDEKHIFEFRKLPLKNNVFKNLWERIIENFPSKFGVVKTSEKPPKTTTNKSSTAQNAVPDDIRLSLPDFSTPDIPPMTRANKIDLLAGHQSSINLLDTYEYNEDSYAIIHYQIQEVNSYATLAVVTCGVGVTSLDGKNVSEIAIKAIVERFDRSNYTNVKSLFVEGFEAAAQRITQYNADKDVLENSDATATCSAVFILDKHIFVASIGNCRIFLLRQGKIIQISALHTLLGKLIDLGKITPDEAIDPNIRISRGLGPAYALGLNNSYPDFRLQLSLYETKEQSVDNQGLLLQSGDQILLCTPSLYGGTYLSPLQVNEMSERLSVYLHPQEVVDKFIALERKDGQSGDLTIVLLKVP